MHTTASPGVVELRRYTLHPGSRETLIELFDRELVEPQEALGLQVLGQFRDLDDPDAFVWLRGFRDMTARASGLAAFYGGPVWRTRRDAANATMVDSDDVLLLRPARPGSGVSVPGARRPPGSARAGGALVVVTVYSLAGEAAAEFPSFFADAVEPVLRAAGAEPLGSYRTEHSPNTYPALPVREGEETFVWLARFADEAAYARHLDALERTAEWRDRLAGEVHARLDRPPVVTRLSPTSRSLLGS